MKFSIVAVNVENLPPDVVGIEGENCRGEGVLLIRIVGSQPAKAKADYIQREGRYSRDRDEVLHTQSGHLPEWAERPADYWDAADLYERANGRLFKEVEFALPVELTLDQQRN